MTVVRVGLETERIGGGEQALEGQERPQTSMCLSLLTFLPHVLPEPFVYFSSSLGLAENLVSHRPVLRKPLAF